MKILVMVFFSMLILVLTTSASAGQADLDDLLHSSLAAYSRVNDSLPPFTKRSWSREK